MHGSPSNGLRLLAGLLLACALPLIGSASAGAATVLDISSCTGSALDLGVVLPDSSVVGSSDCAVGFGSTTETAQLRISQGDGVGTAMPNVADYADGSADWDAGANAFGACLRATGPNVTASWGVDGDADCAAVDTDPWNAIPVAPTEIARTSVNGVTQSALLRFGVRTSATQAPGAQSAGLVIEVIDLTVNSAPNAPTLVSPADAAIVASTTPELTATFSDPDAGDTGRVNFELCSTSTCTTILQSGSSTSGLANNTNGSWTIPTALTPGTTYWWRATNTDALGLTSTATSTRSFTVNSAPNAPTLVSPADAAIVASTTPELTATFSDPNNGDTGRVNFELCSTSACTTILQSGSSTSGLASNTNGSWTIPTALTAGTTYWWRATSTDALGLTSTPSSTRSFTIQASNTAPNVPILVSPENFGYEMYDSVTFVATFSDPDAGDTGRVEFETCWDASCLNVAKQGPSSSGLTSGTNGSWTTCNAWGPAGTTVYWRARNVDAAGLTSAWSGTWSFDTMLEAC